MVSLGAFEATQHLSLLTAWLRLPHVSRWWGDPDEAIAAVVDRPSGAGHFMIVADDRAVGYLRFQRPSRQELDEVGLADIPDGVIDIDILIGDRDHLGRGIGPRALELLLRYLARYPENSLAGMVTSTSNQRAIRAYEKAGFRKLRTYTDPAYGECWVMLMELRTLDRGR